MHHYIHYDESESAEKKVDRKALNDFLRYTGKRPFKTLVQHIKQGTENAESIRFAASFVGVQGRPVTALIRRYNPTLLKRDQNR